MSDTLLKPETPDQLKDESGSSAPICSAPHFSELSERAQDLIVDAAMGLIKEPPKMSDSVSEEIRAWAWGPECDPQNGAAHLSEAEE